MIRLVVKRTGAKLPMTFARGSGRYLEAVEMRAPRVVVIRDRGVVHCKHRRKPSGGRALGSKH